MHFVSVPSPAWCSRGCSRGAGPCLPRALPRRRRQVAAQPRPRPHTARGGVKKKRERERKEEKKKPQTGNSRIKACNRLKEVTERSKGSARKYIWGLFQHKSFVSNLFPAPEMSRNRGGRGGRRGAPGLPTAILLQGETKKHSPLLTVPRILACTCTLKLEN